MQRTCLYRTSGAVSQMNSSQPVFSEVTWLCQSPVLAVGVRPVWTARVCMRREGPRTLHTDSQGSAPAVEVSGNQGT